MKTKLLRSKSRKYLLIFSSLILLSAVPFFAGSGLDDAEPLDSYLNNNFPAVLAQGLPYEPIYPNITFDSPLTFNEVPNANKIIIGQRNGKIFWFDKTPNVSVKNELIDLSNKVGLVWDGGFLGLALHPKFGTSGNNFFYTWYSTKDANGQDLPNNYTIQNCDNEESWGNFLVLRRYQMNPNTLAVQESSEQTLLKLRMYGTTHRGGGLVFGDDGFLYLTTGDQTAFKKSQDITNNLDGGVLRIDVDRDNTKSHPPVRTMPDDHGFSDEITGNGYWIPNDNPFLSPTGQNFEEYYSLGHRNPHRMTKDRATGDLYVGEIGGGKHEEINVIKKGRNYGWPLYEGLFINRNCVSDLLNSMQHERPLTFFPRAEANAIIGGYVYRGSEIPELQGKYVCADYGRGEEIWTIDTTTGDYTQLGDFTSTNIISFGEDQQGELYIMKQGVSSLYKMVSKDNPTTQMPNLLSETGAFKNLNTLEPTDGLIPYELVESFWSDGALKKRWIGIPNDGSHDTSGEKINYSEDDVWNFPIGSVLVKHFELPIDAQNPSITKRLETRFSIKAADGNFYFNTYKWNDQGTDAVLLTSGLDETITIRNADGSADTQTWSYPSNSDCISCHNPTTGGTLGTRTRFLNTDYTYPKTGRTANQLVTLSSLGILDEVITDANTGTFLTAKALDDPNASLDEKARSYMDLNCANCHQPGTGNRGSFDLRLKLDLVQTGLLTSSAYESLGIPNEKIIDPGNPETSILYHRLNSIDPSIMMPAVSKNKVDDEAVQLINDWISQLTPEDNPCANRIIMDSFDNVPGNTLVELRSNTNFPDTPTRTNELTEFRIPSNISDNYGARVQGILKAPETGTYYFWIEGDDNVELNLSTDENETNKVRIAYHENWTFPDEWNKFPTQKSAGVSLVAGQNYYIEALMNEGIGGDNLAVGWRKPSDGNGNVPVEVLPCTVFDYFDGPPVVNVSGVSLTTNSATLVVGDTLLLNAVVSPADADDPSLTWFSDDFFVAVVNTDGRVRAFTEGTATITVTTIDGSFRDTAVITVEAAPVAVTDVLIVPESARIAVGATQALTATILPSNADDRSVTWGSNNLAAATVDANGLVTAVGEGNATITATTNDGNFTATSQIDVFTPVVNVSGVSLNTQTSTVELGGTRRLIATVIPEDANDKTVTWSSSDTSIATVNSNGLIAGIAEGEVTITVRTNDGDFIATALVTVRRTTVFVTGVSVAPTSSTIEIGSSQLLTATISPVNASDTALEWSVNDSNIAAVNSNGLVTGLSAGNTSVTVTTNDGGYTVTASITVEQASSTCTAIGSILMERYDNISGYTIPDLLSAPNYPDAPSSSEALFSMEILENTGDDYGVRLRGQLCAPETGTYYFYVSGNNHSELSLSTSSDEADKVRIAYHESWTSNKEWDKFPSQKSQGIVLQQGGTYYIEALMKEGAFGDHLAAGWRRPSNGNGALAAEVVPGNVLSPIVLENVAVNNVSLAPTNLNLRKTEVAPLNATISPFNASDTTVTWSSSNVGIATVSPNGNVLAISEGNAVITVTTNDGGFTAQTNILVLPDNNEACTASGTILMERYEDIPGYTITDLLNAPIYPDAPTSVAELSSFEIAENTGDNYGIRVRGFLCAPETGTYYFFVAGNNYAELNLSSNQEASDKVRIAYNEGWTSNKEWNKFPSQKSQGIVLRKGDSYYIEALLKEGSFGDHLSVGWRKPSDGNAALAAEVVPGNVLSPSLTTDELGQFLVWDVEALRSNGPSFVLSPNPATTQLNILISNIEEGTQIGYAIYSVSGSEVLRFMGGLNETIDVSTLAKGTYIIVVNSNAWSSSKNLIIR